MRVLVSIYHPAHVHFFRHTIAELQADGHDVHVCARDKDITLQLLRAYDIPHRILSGTPSSLHGLAIEQAKYEYRLFREARRFQPDVMTSIGGIEVSHVAPLVGARTVVFNDSEGTPGHLLMVTSALNVICTPRRFTEYLGQGHRRYDGYHELAYLHPNRFQPNPASLRSVGIDPHDRFFVLRFVAWNAHHDVAQHGFSPDAKRELVSRLSARGDVYITQEGRLPTDLEPYRTPIPPHLMHDLLAFSDLYVGDSQTMATEAAILGTPAIRSNSFAETNEMSNFVELEEEYGLLYSIPDEDDAIDTAIALTDDPEIQEEWRRRQESLLADKIDVTSYAVAVLQEEAERASRARPVENRSVIDRLQAYLSGGGSE